VPQLYRKMSEMVVIVPEEETEKIGRFAQSEAISGNHQAVSSIKTHKNKPANRLASYPKHEEEEN